MIGKIIKGIAGFYYIYVEQKGVYECKAKGIFRNQKKKPLVGDNVEIEVLDERKRLGNIISLLPRSSELVRPAVANVDQALVIFAAAEPDPNLNLLDRFIITMERQNIPTILCFNKRDIASRKQLNRLQDIYGALGYPIVFTSTKTKEGIEAIREIIKNKTTTLAGPSGVGKSSLLNILNPEIHMEIGEISEKIKRGRHTTRHSELFYMEENTYMLDTPGFTSLYVTDFEKDDLKEYFIEFEKYEGKCRFKGCAHVNEPDCRVKEALAQGSISPERYKSYLILYEEIKNNKRY